MTTTALQTERGVANWLGTDHHGLIAMMERREIIGCPDASGSLVFPTVQFCGTGIVPHLSRVLTVLSEGTTDCWTWAGWLAAEVPWQFEGMSIARWLATGRDPDAVIVAARQAVYRWSS